LDAWAWCLSAGGREVTAAAASKFSGSDLHRLIRAMIADLWAPGGPGLGSVPA